LWTFEQAIHSGKYKELADLSHFRRFERLIVTHDRTYLSNSVLRKSAQEKLRDDGTAVPEEFHWHLISIDEFEDLLGLRDANLFNVLEAKRLDPEDDEMDFGDYLSKRYHDSSPANSYLDRIQEEFFSRFV